MIINQEFIEKRPLSYSSLKAFKKSPKHYIHYITEPRTVSPQMILGQVVDCIVLEPEKFEKKFMIVEKIDRRTKQGKIDYEQALNKSRDLNLTMINKEVHDTALSCKESLYSHNEARQLIEAKKAVQKRLTWRNKATELPMVGYLDFESEAWGELSLVDLKTTNNADPVEFSKQVAKLDYTLQAGAYLDAYHKKYYKFPYFLFLAVETSEPFNVSLNFCDNKFIDDAKAEFFGTLKAFRKCMDDQSFHMGYEFRLMAGTGYFSIHLPRYYDATYKGYE